MEYYKLFNLEKEPFSNTPDPEFFFRSNRHAECLQKLEISIRLRRGLCIVHGEVGTGKTTLCRQMVRLLAGDENIAVHMVLDPGFDRTEDFAATVNEMLTGYQNALACSTVAEHKEMIKNHLFDRGMDSENTIVLIIEEGQKLPVGCAEFLRELLNYETNEDKLLQIVIFAQNEIQDLLLSQPNFADRAALYHHLKPLTKKETAQLIRYRLQTAGNRDTHPAAPVFTRRSVARIYRLTRGYPRKIINLCHHILLLLLVRGQGRVTPAIVNRAASSVPFVQKTSFPGSKWTRAVGMAAATALAGVIVIAAYAHWPAASGPEPKAETEAKAVAQKNAPPEKQDPAAKKSDKEVAPEPPAKELPSVLGRVRINENENLWNMVKRIYGTSSAGIVEELKAANPDLRDPARIRAGQKIRFPVLENHPVPKQQHYWIAWQKSDNLNQVYQFIFNRRAADLNLLSYWHPSAGLQHAAVNKKSFAEYSQAEQALPDPDKSLAEEAEILNLSKDGIRLLTGGQKG
ncbi:MAG: AAA family ATPase [Desulfobacteraceae bacterium]|nr:AAA family ATPase [Desulfobacteraceae bacterium]